MDYWRLRELDHIDKMIKDDAKIARKIKSNQLRAMEEIQDQIDAFYGRYANVEGISMSEARKRVGKADVNKYNAKAKRYVKESNFSKQANEEMRLYNVSMKINRLELLKANVHLELLAMTSEEQRILFESMTKNARAEYERQSGILGETLNHSEKGIASIVNASFLNATWSDRLWDNQDALRSELDRLLNRGIVQGKNPRELARDLRKKFNTSVYNSERLMRSELAVVQTRVQEDSYRQGSFSKYEFISEPDACSLCKPLDGKKFDVDKMEIGKNAPIIHAHCRCSTAAYVDRDAWDADLKARGL